MDALIRRDKEQLDRVYGLKDDLRNVKFTIGKTTIDLVGRKIKIGNITYKGTPGLYELLFKKEPIGFNKDDLEQ